MNERWRAGVALSQLFERVVLGVDHDPGMEEVDSGDLPENAPPIEAYDLSRFGYHHSSKEPCPPIVGERMFERFDGQWWPAHVEFARRDVELQFLSYLNELTAYFFQDEQGVIVGREPLSPDGKMRALDPDWLDHRCRIDFERDLFLQPVIPTAPDRPVDEWQVTLMDLRLWRRRDWLNFKAIAEAEIWTTPQGAAASTLHLHAPNRGTHRQPAVPSSNKAEQDCRQWLLQIMRAQPEVPIPKDDLRFDASTKFPRLSGRGFDRAWARAVEVHPAWSRAGRRPTQEPSN